MRFADFVTSVTFECTEEVQPEVFLQDHLPDDLRDAVREYLEVVKQM